MAKRVYTKEGKEALTQKFSNLGAAIQAGLVTTWPQVFAYIEPTPMARSLNIAYDTFIRKVSHPGDFKIEECRQFAKLANVDVLVIISFMLQVKPLK